MNKKVFARTTFALVAAAAFVAAGYVAGSRHAATNSPAAAVAAAGGKIDPKTGRKVLYWHDPMVPNQHFDKPGKSPFMDMQLVPVYADEGGPSGIRIDAGLQQNLGIRYATVGRRDVSEGFDAVGTTQFDESMAAVIQARTTGYIDRLYTRAPMQRVTRGEPIASIFVPDWLAPQEEYLALKASHADANLLAASRARMRALSIPDGVVTALDRTGKAQTHAVLVSPANGVLTELNVREGAMVAPGQTLAKVEGLSTLWLIIDIPEALALQVRPGMTVDATVADDPTRHFSGHIREILPGISTGTRTLQARLEIDNPGTRLTPGMLMRAHIGAAKPVSRLVVPSEAIITTGRRSVVIVRNADGRLQPAIVTVGNDTGDDTEITDGLTEGQQVVASGQFLIDSEANLKSVLPRLEGSEARGGSASTPAPASTAAASRTYETTGKVEQVTAAGITFSHQAVPALGWGAMTMTFNKPAADAFPDIKVGQTVHFVFKQTDDGYQLTQVEPVGGAQ
ncbi:efflux RND transporter periplasmic adaptor subunit (plasmid) [Burkholderia thailandensis]|uniref:efflux RND transporter periplasmic adaptor subunit n=1 Tax=Burkholderia thailandensis TaxID=57975 RepID=UPI00192E25B3|nr:efflux RND transporter periplasmic adaptor subunit [Burkholderia thailandensis]MBS2132237.1 efflux RND transporter periplasmic adaptor subunit [Burkholderia thailandensis]QRA15330.1 efflux RND transporter periplasmic adaptor subunit [Burkholderia thailandensis]